MKSRLNLSQEIIFGGVKLGIKPIVCVPVVSTEKKIIDKLKKLNNKIKLIEIRFDYIYNYNISEDIFKIISDIGIPYIFTFRSHMESDRGKNALKVDFDTRIKWYMSAIEQGASMIDFELSSIKEYKKFLTLVEKAKNKNVGVIISYHNFQETPDVNNLLKIMEEENEYGADVLKVATMVKKFEDIITLNMVTLKIREKLRKPLMTMGMGEIGISSRISTIAFGSDVVFAFIGKSSAPGQISYYKIDRIISYLY